MALESGWKTGKGIRRAFSREDPRQVKFRNLAKKKKAKKQTILFICFNDTKRENNFKFQLVNKVS